VLFLLFRLPTLFVNNLQGVEGFLRYNLEIAILAVFFIFFSGFSLAPQFDHLVTHLRKTLCHSLFNMTSDLLADALFFDFGFSDYSRIYYGTYSATPFYQLTHTLDSGQLAQLDSALVWDSGLSLALWARPLSFLDNSFAVRSVSFAQVAHSCTHSNLPLSLIPLLCEDSKILAHSRFWLAGCGLLLEIIQLAVGPGFSPASGFWLDANSFRGLFYARVSGVISPLSLRLADGLRPSGALSIDAEECRPALTKPLLAALILNFWLWSLAWPELSLTSGTALESVTCPG
jgi:hypothetical protein